MLDLRRTTAIAVVVRNTRSFIVDNPKSEDLFRNALDVRLRSLDQDVYFIRCARAVDGDHGGESASSRLPNIVTAARSLPLLTRFRGRWRYIGVAMNPHFGGLLLASLSGMSLLGGSFARADDFGKGANRFVIDFVEVGNPGNGDDAGEGGRKSSSPYGGVAYKFFISVTEVPQAWITKASNAGLSGVVRRKWRDDQKWGDDQPATMINWYEAAAFVNWLNTSTGHQPAYNLRFDGSWSMTLWSQKDAWQTGGENRYRHKDAHYFLPSEDEWYKSAYHKNNGATANYWGYATASNEAPRAVASGVDEGTAVFFPSYSIGIKGPAAVDRSGGPSSYKTRGQNGNVQEWMESSFDGKNDSPDALRAVRDEDWSHVLPSRASRWLERPASGTSTLGFRVARRS